MGGGVANPRDKAILVLAWTRSASCLRASKPAVQPLLALVSEPKFTQWQAARMRLAFADLARKFFVQGLKNVAGPMYDLVPDAADPVFCIRLIQ